MTERERKVYASRPKRANAGRHVDVRAVAGREDIGAERVSADEVVAVCSISKPHRWLAGASRPEVYFVGIHRIPRERGSWFWPVPYTGGLTIIVVGLILTIDEMDRDSEGIGH